MSTIIIVDRTKAGLEAARARGRLGGRPKKLTMAQRQNVIDLYDGNHHSLKEICEIHVRSSPKLEPLRVREFIIWALLRKESLDGTETTRIGRDHLEASAGRS